MVGGELIKGNVYSLKDAECELIYVRNEFIPSTGKHWATFYFTVRDFQAHLKWDDFSFKRARIPLAKIVLDKRNKISSLGGFEDWETFAILSEYQHSDIVKSWLGEVRGMLQAKGYSDIDNMFTGNFPGNCSSRSRTPFCVRLGEYAREERPTL